ncbi:MAG TPA: hypothetical protein VFK32_02670 [Tepidiformaceae bacterium]|nr:hypothetical protein [Tepidiformaceae bacterium]
MDATGIALTVLLFTIAIGGSIVFAATLVMSPIGFVRSRRRRPKP